MPLPSPKLQVFDEFYWQQQQTIGNDLPLHCCDHPFLHRNVRIVAHVVIKAGKEEGL